MRDKTIAGVSPEAAPEASPKASPGGRGFLTTAEAARVMGVGEEQVRKLLRRGVMRSIRFGNHHRIPVEEVYGARAALRAERRYLTVADVAKELKVHRNTVMGEIGSGRLIARKRLIGKGLLVRPGDFEAWKKRRMEDSSGVSEGGTI